MVSRTVSSQEVKLHIRTHKLRLTRHLGGTAGMVLANRLSEIENARVLVVEAGFPPTVVINYESPGGTYRSLAVRHQV